MRKIIQDMSRHIKKKTNIIFQQQKQQFHKKTWKDYAKYILYAFLGFLALVVLSLTVL